MKRLKTFFHFFGGVHLAIGLIACAACLVIAGTFLESWTDSHLLAARWTYENPFFLVLLILFFINILFAALRRWPFKKKHIPFLITHLGLLMIISGTIMKNRWGLQGQLRVWEGSGNQDLLLPYTHALFIEKKGDHTPKKSMIEFDSFRSQVDFPYHFPQLKCKLVGFTPHVKQELETWIKGSNAYIAGFPFIPVHDWTPDLPFPIADSYRYALATNFPQWSILALRTTSDVEALHQAYIQGLKLVIKSKIHPLEIHTVNLAQALKAPFSFAEGKMKVSFDFTSILTAENTIPSLIISWRAQGNPEEEKFVLPLQGQGALILRPLSSEKNWINPSFIVDLIRPEPFLCLIKNAQETIFSAFDIHGRVHLESFPSSQLKSLFAYDGGFEGYGVQAIIPIPSVPNSREDKEKADAHALIQQLKKALIQTHTLSPPLVFFQEACLEAKVDFAEAFIQFLQEWNARPDFLFNDSQSLSETLKKALSCLNWTSLSDNDKQSIQWTYRLLDRLNESQKLGFSPLLILKQNHWPFLDQFEFQDSSPLNTLAQQIVSLIPSLPTIEFPSSFSLEDQTKLLSAYFRIHGIDYPSLFYYWEGDKEDFERLLSYWRDHSNNPHFKHEMIFETPLSQRIVPDTAPLRIEDQCPGIVLEFQEGKDKDKIALAFDHSAAQLKWPILNGNYCIRFQPKLRELPYRVRLREARQISYPQSQQAYSYESDVLISERGKNPTAQTLSMNRVYETWDGYRFYLAGIGKEEGDLPKRIQLAVNYDPAKYILTYPGALLVFLGIVLLFWGFRKH